MCHSGRHSNSLLTEVIRILKSDPNITLTYPFSPSFSAQIIEDCHNLIRKLENSVKSINTVLNECKGNGYSGDDLQEAVHYLVNHLVEIERRKSIEKHVNEIGELRKIHSQEVSILTQNKEKTMEQVKKCREQIIALEKQFQAKEDNYINDLENLKTEQYSLSDKLRKQQRIKDELITFVSGKPADIEFLSVNLSDIEKKSINLKI